MPVRTLEFPEGWRILSASGDGRYIALTAAYAKKPNNKIYLVIDDEEIIELQGFEAKLVQATFSSAYSGEREH